MARITALVPNYNHARFLPAALEALLAQTRPADEVVIIDDASTDDSVAVIERFLPRFGNARLIRNQVNRGVIKNLNAGLDLVTGDLIIFLAADDVIYPDYLRAAEALLENYPQAALVSGRSDLIDIEGRRIGEFNSPSPLPEPGFLSGGQAARLLDVDGLWICGNVTMYRRDLLKQVGGFKEHLRAVTDGFAVQVLAVTHGACYSPQIWGGWRRIEGGYAWTDTENLAEVRKLAAVVEAEMTASGAPFRRGYPRRWRRRYIFGARRFILANARRRARRAGPLAYAAAAAREFTTVAWLFIALRPGDVASVIRRLASRGRPVGR